MVDTCWEEYSLLFSCSLNTGAGLGGIKSVTLLLDHIAQDDFFERLEQRGWDIFVIYSVTPITHETLQLLKDKYSERDHLFE